MNLEGLVRVRVNLQGLVSVRKQKFTPRAPAVSGSELQGLARVKKKVLGVSLAFAVRLSTVGCRVKTSRFGFKVWLRK